MPPTETAEVTLGEVNRNVERLNATVERLSQQIVQYPTWQDVSRVEKGLESKIAVQARAIADLAEAAKAAKARTYGALATGAGGIVTALVVWALTGR